MAQAVEGCRQMSPVVVFGNSDWADLAHMYLTHDSPHDVVAFTVDRDHLNGTEHRGLPAVAFEQVVKEFPPDRHRMFIPISYNNMNRLRAAKYEQAKAWGYRFISYVSSKAATWPGFSCGDNCFILEGNVIQPFVQVGHDVVMMSGNHIGHHSVIKDHVTITGHVVVSGRCTIEPYCFLGVNSTIRDQIVLAEGTLVGAGAVILQNTKEWQMYKAVATDAAGIRSDRLRSI
jgi:sugar O-acyltransferase (sialic acid O-acetyltransferase NeuD family)